MVELDFEMLQNFNNKTVNRQSKDGIKEHLKTTNSPSSSGISSTPETCPTLDPKYPNCCISCTRPEETRDIPNSTVCPSNNSANDIESLTVFSDDNTFDDVIALDDIEEEDGIVYHLQRRIVCFTWVRSSVANDLVV